jgi:hypothetical protein
MRLSFALAFAFLFSGIGFLPASAEARIFDISKETFASYLMVSGGPSSIHQSAFANEANTTTSYSDETKTNLGGEFGFLYSTPAVNFRFGFEIMKPASFGATATNASGAALYNVQNDLTAYSPKFGIEINLKPLSVARSFLLLSAGAASLSMKNDYTLTPAGQSAFAGVSDHSVEAKSSAPEYAAGLGFEFLMSDNTTLMLEGGYRLLKFTQMKYSKDVTTFTGAKTAGSTVTDANGQNRTIDMSGAIFSLGLRIYL